MMGRDSRTAGSEGNGSEVDAVNKATIRVRRIYDAPESADGERVLVDRLWPRGVSKERAELSQWIKDIAPSSQLRKWYGHDPAKFDEFTRRYRVELNDADHTQALAALQRLVARGTLTLLTASKREDISEAAVLQRLLKEQTSA